MTVSKETEGALAFLEAAYSWDLPENEWLGRLADAAAQVWGQPRWACGFTYDASDIQQFKISRPVVRGGPATVERLVSDGMSQQTPEFVARTLRSLSMGFGRPLGGVSDESDQGLARLDTVDFFGLNGLDPSGRACFIGLGTERPVMTAQEIAVFQRLSFHLSSAYRIRRRLKEQDEGPMVHWEALLRPDGELMDARGEAKGPDERQALARAARNMEHIRRSKNREPTPHWFPRIRGRWTLIDAFTRAGERFIVARENQSTTPGFGALTAREQQVIASVASGRSNKEIAYELGISPSTTRVLLSRAYARLGVSSREQLLQLPSIKALRGEAPDPAR
jgi:DNA-binding CsgD family transcriptional regulator